MRKHIAVLAFAALMAGVSTSAHAQRSWYVRADVGYSVDGELDTSRELRDEDVSEARIAPPGPQALTINQAFNFDDDALFSGAIGYNYDNGFRVEAEVARRENDLENTSVEAEAKSLMLNVFYDFNRGGRFQPYIGAGVGYADVDVGDSDNSNFAWQAIAGVAAPIGDRLTVDLAYRYFNVDDLSFENGLDADYNQQAVTLGLRYRLGADAPVAPPLPPQQPAEPPVTTAPVACPASEFVVYFEWDRSNLNQAALDVIDQAIARARECNVQGATVVGHTDTSGSAAYNVGLSERRAGVVRDALIARGMNAGAINTQARGETELARATANGVREPLNRRTAVTISFR
jgi:outer membrane protein OmpA-like peptidoglycan-associated protein